MITDDQPMPGCARCRDGVVHTNHVIGEALTPTSSLEEARTIPGVDDALRVLSQGGEGKA